jgi:hypothetical protein
MKTQSAYGGHFNASRRNLHREKSLHQRTGHHPSESSRCISPCVAHNPYGRASSGAQARRCWAQVSTLRLGQATFEDARRLSDRFGGYNSTTGGQQCKSDWCDFTFPFENRWLTRAQLAPYAGITIHMVVSNGQVISLGFAYTVAAAYASYFVGEAIPSTGSSRFEVNVNRDLHGGPNKVTVHLTTEATSAEREKAFSIDWACLASIRGCDERYKVFPLLAEISKE